MKKAIKQPKYAAGNSLRGYGVWDIYAQECLYFVSFSNDKNKNVDSEVLMSKIAGLLNVTESPAADERLIETINKQLQEFAQYKVQ